MVVSGHRFSATATRHMDTSTMAGAIWGLGNVRWLALLPGLIRECSVLEFTKRGIRRHAYSFDLCP